MGYTHKKISSQNNNFLKELIHSVFGNLAVCLAASVRFILLTSIDYHDHVTEWGTHWNFYLTIAVLNVVFVFVRSSDYALVVGLALLIG
jgi:phosphatidylinositol glycan class W